MYKIIGEIKKIDKDIKINDTLLKTDLVIETIEEYAQFLRFEFFNENAKFLVPFRPGEKIEVVFKIKGKIYKENNYFTNLVGIRAHKTE